ncbi:MAG TPA: hypothetical protein VNC59_05285, partial [Thermoanaerobaculia bacterium]|nr:hypothetical protein [Thermoanaerobaculia bacterium]
AKFGVRVASWKTATAVLPAHAFIVGTTTPDAVHDEAGNLVAAGSTTPVSYALRVPASRQIGRLILSIPPGSLEHTEVLGALAILARDGYSVATVNRLLYSDARLAPIGNPSATRDELTDSYSQGLKVAKQLYSKLFGKPEHTYEFAFSRGVLLGFGLMRNVKSLCDGRLLVVGSAGLPTRIEETLRVIHAGSPYTVPRTGLALDYQTLYDRLLNAIGHVDPEYSAAIQNGSASPLDYDLSTRPESVRDWNFPGNLQVPTIILQGLGDVQAWPGDTVLWDQRINAAHDTELKRLYFVPRMIHGPWPAVPSRDAFRMLEAWVERGEEPGTLSFPALTAVVPNSHQLGLEQDPAAYLDYMLGQ